MKRHYTPEEANAILERALRQKPLPGDMSREQLLRTAEEVGITPEELEAAEAEWRARSEPEPDTDMEALRAEYLEYRARLMARVRFLVAGFMALMLVTGMRAGHLSGLLMLQPLVLAILLVAVTYWKAGSPVCEHSFQRWLRRRNAYRSFPRGL